MPPRAYILVLAAAAPPPQPRMVQIFTEACRLFAERGFEGTSMRDIAEVCGISKPTLYHYFADKDAIVRPLMLGITRIIHDRVAARLDPAHLPLEQLRLFMVETASSITRMPSPTLGSWIHTLQGPSRAPSSRTVLKPVKPPSIWALNRS